MASNKLSNFNFTLIKRPQPKNGPSSSDVWNDSIDELLVDLSNIAAQWNNQLETILNALPNGSVDTNIDAFANGLDGTSLWTKDGAVSGDGEPLWNTNKARANTVTEALVYLKGYVDTAVATIPQGPVGPAGPAGTGVSGLTPGSVIFGGPTGSSAQDNSKLFWNDTNHFLGIGTNTPTAPLQIKGHAGNSSGVGTTTAQLKTTNATQSSLWTTTLSNANMYWLEATVMARSDTDASRRALFVRKAYAYKQGGNATLSSNIWALITDRTDVGFDATFTASGDNISVSVSGLAGTNITWTGEVKWQSVAV
jgi:hypothetical protein